MGFLFFGKNYDKDDQKVRANIIDSIEQLRKHFDPKTLNILCRQMEAGKKITKNAYDDDLILKEYMDKALQLDIEYPTGNFPYDSLGSLLLMITSRRNRDINLTSKEHVYEMKNIELKYNIMESMIKCRSLTEDLSNASDTERKEIQYKLSTEKKKIVNFNMTHEDNLTDGETRELKANLLLCQRLSNADENETQDIFNEYKKAEAEMLEKHSKIKAISDELNN